MPLLDGGLVAYLADKGQSWERKNLLGRSARSGGRGVPERMRITQSAYGGDEARRDGGGGWRGGGHALRCTTTGTFNLIGTTPSSRPTRGEEPVRALGYNKM